MAITAASRGSVGSQTSTTTVTFSPSANFAAGSWAVLFYVVDNSNTNGAAHTSITVTDTDGNTWTRRVSGVYDPNIANNGLEVGVFTTDMDGATLSTGTTITVTTSTAATAKVALLWEVIPDASNTLSYISGAATAGRAAGVLPNVTTTSITSGDIVLAGAHIEYKQTTITGDSDTTNGSWSSDFWDVSSATNVGPAGMTLLSQYKVVTGTATQSHDVASMGNSADNISTWVQLRQAAGGTDVNADVPAGSLVFAGTAPTASRTVAVPAGSLAFAGVAATASLTAAVPAGSIALAGTAPTSALTASVAVGSVTFAGVAATAGTGVSVAAELLAFAGTAPAANFESLVASATFTFTGVAAAAAITASVPAGALEFAGNSPTAEVGAAVDPGVITFAGLSPSFSGSAAVDPGAITFAGNAATGNLESNVPAGALALAGNSPIVNLESIVPAGALEFAGTAPVGDRTLTVPVGLLAMQGGPRNAIQRFNFNGATSGTVFANSPTTPLFGFENVLFQLQDPATWDTNFGAPTNSTITPTGDGFIVEFDRAVTTGNRQIEPYSIIADTSGSVTIDVLDTGRNYPVTAEISTLVPAGEVAFTGSQPVAAVEAAVSVGEIVFVGPLASASETLQTAVISGCVRIYTSVSGNVEVAATIDGSFQISRAMSGCVEVANTIEGSLDLSPAVQGTGEINS